MIHGYLVVTVVSV